MTKTGAPLKSVTFWYAADQDAGRGEHGREPLCGGFAYFVLRRAA